VGWGAGGRVRSVGSGVLFGAESVVDGSLGYVYRLVFFCGGMVVVCLVRLPSCGLGGGNVEGICWDGRVVFIAFGLCWV